MDKYNFALEQHTFGEGHGPSVVITGGIHGDEQTGSHTARLVIRMLKSARVRLTALRPVQPGEIPYQEAKD